MRILVVRRFADFGLVLCEAADGRAVLRAYNAQPPVLKPGLGPVERQHAWRAALLSFIIRPSF